MLFSVNALGPLESTHISIAHKNIQERRARTTITIPPGGNLHNYVPFYFAPRSPMLYAISKNAVTTYGGGQKEIIYLRSSVETIDKSGKKWLFSNRNASLKNATFYNRIEDLSLLDWEVMGATMWNSTPEDGDKSERRQAELLVWENLEWALVEGLSVMNNLIKQQVVEILTNCPWKPPISINPGWYF